MFVKFSKENILILVSKIPKRKLDFFLTILNEKPIKKKKNYINIRVEVYSKEYILLILKKDILKKIYLHKREMNKLVRENLREILKTNNVFSWTCRENLGKTRILVIRWDIVVSRKLLSFRKTLKKKKTCSIILCW